MGHNLLGQRFYNNREAPAWHGLGVNDPAAHTAEEALRRIGEYSVEKRPLYLPSDDGMVESGFFALMREPIAEDPQWRQFGTPVSAQYEVIAPIDAARIRDRAFTHPKTGVMLPVETVGILGRGERMFMVSKLPSFEVRGDQVDTYVLFDNPLANGIAIGVYTTPVRTVCQNTLNSALRLAQQQATIVHTAGAGEYLERKMREMFVNALAAKDAIEADLVRMAQTRVNDIQVKWIVDSVYPLPATPSASDRSRAHIEDRLRRYEYNVALVKRLRALAINLYDGLGTGSDAPATAGTAYGVYNAIAELETYRRGKLDKAVAGLLNGNRGTRIRNAYTLAMNVEASDTVDMRRLGLKRVTAF